MVVDLGSAAAAAMLVLIAANDRPCADFSDKDKAGACPPEVILDFDDWPAVLKKGR